jgi:hypothetical protein
MDAAIGFPRLREERRIDADICDACRDEKLRSNFELT